MSFEDAHGDEAVTWLVLLVKRVIPSHGTPDCVAAKAVDYGRGFLSSRRRQRVAQAGKVTTNSITLSPPNSLVLVMDHSSGELPEAINEQLVALTDSCVAVGTLSEVDGATTITLTNSLEGVKRGKMVFDGVLKVPRHELSVCSVADTKLLTMTLPSSEAHVQIFANDHSEPDEIVVFVHVS